jgi:hypothetical protein
MIKKTWLLLAVFLLFGAAPPARATGGESGPQDRLERLWDNLNHMQVTVTLDRSTPYFPGETATVTVTLANPTSAPLEIPGPQAPGVAAFAISMLGGPFTKSKSEWSTFEPFDPTPEDVPSTVVPPGKSLTLVFHPEDRLVPPWETYGEMPAYPGMYRLYCALADLTQPLEFQVGAPVLEASAIVPLQEFKTYQEPGMDKPETVQKAAAIVAVRLGGEHLLLAAQHNTTTTSKVETEEDGTLTSGETHGGAPWVRLLTVPSKVTSLKGTADATGLITLEYTTADGGGGKIYLDKNRHPL